MLVYLFFNLQKYKLYKYIPSGEPGEEGRETKSPIVQVDFHCAREQIRLDVAQ